MYRRSFALFMLVAAACGGSPLVHFDAEAPEVPFIDQLNPSGKEPGYDGSEFCGPAVLAGIARVYGQGAGLTDAALIEELAFAAGTDADIGTSGNGMLAGIAWLGLSSDASPGADLDWVDGELSLGHDVIAQGDYYAVPGRQDPTRHSGHYIAISGVGNGWRLYRVTDPASGSVRWMTDDELGGFISVLPTGGFTISAW